MINSKQNRFNQLLNAIEDGNPKTLSVRLREMEKHGLIKRKVYSNEKPVRVEYRPTEDVWTVQDDTDLSTNQILKLNRMIDEFDGSLEKKREEMAYMNQEHW